MNSINCWIILFILFALANNIFGENEDESFMDERDASEFSNIEKRFLYTGKEQRREAKENYEEKCERKLLSAARQKPRWCPELETWPAWNQWRAKDGALYNQFNKPRPGQNGPYPSGGGSNQYPKPYPNNPYQRPNPNNPYPRPNPNNPFQRPNSNNGPGFDNFDRVPYDPDQNYGNFPFGNQKKPQPNNNPNNPF